MPEYDQKIMQDFARLRRARQREAAARIGQAVGGTAETLRTGASAAETFAKREPQHNTMSAREKIAASIPLVERQGKEEMFYYGQALERELAYLQQQELNYRAALSAAASKYATMTTAAKARAQLQTRRLEHDIGLLRQDREKLLTASSQSVQEFEGLAAGLDAELAQEKAQLVAALKESNPDADAAAVEAAAEQAVNATLPSRMAELVDGVTEGKEPGQARAIMQMMGSRYGISIEDMKTAPGGERLEELDKQVAELLYENGEQTDAKLREWVPRANQTFGSSGELDSLITHGQQGATRRQAVPVRGEAAPPVGGSVREMPDVAGAYREGARQVAAGAAPGGRSPVADPRVPVSSSMEPYRPPEPGEPVENFDTEQQQQEQHQMPQDSLFGLPIQPASTAAERTQQLLELIEEQPELPQAKEVKQQIMANPQFQQFKKDRGYADDDFAFREMAREYRIKRKTDVKSDRATRRRNIEQGMVPGRAPQKRPVKMPSTPVHGAVSRNPGEV